MASRVLAFLLALACALTAQPVLARPACPRASVGCKHCLKAAAAPTLKCGCCGPALQARGAARQAPQAAPELEPYAGPSWDVPASVAFWTTPAAPLRAQASRRDAAAATPRPPPLQRNRLLLS
jgi:hypothetical protein